MGMRVAPTTSGGLHSIIGEQDEQNRNPTATIEVGTEQFEVRATIVTEEPQRSMLYAKMVAHRDGFAEYEQKTTRKIPAVLLERIE
jgi:hypothetical protein